MINLPESSINLIISGIMGILGGLLTLPINAFFAYSLKRDEIKFQNRLDEISKKRELLLQHQLELHRMRVAKELERPTSVNSNG